MASVIQRSFAGGEIAPALYARADQVKYATGLRTCKNFIVLRHGGAQNRPGFQYIATAKTLGRRARLLKFVFNAEQTYVLEFGHLYMRVYREGARLTVSGVAAWSNAIAYVVGDLVVDAGVNYYCILAHTNQQPPNATYWYPLTSDIYEIPTPYDEAYLPDLQYVQSGDVVTIVHPSTGPRELARTDHTRWTLGLISTTPSIAAPTGVNAAAGVAPGSAPATPTGLAASGGAAVAYYKVTAFNQSPSPVAESAASAATSSSGSGGDATITWNTVSGAEGYALYKADGGTGPGIYGLIYVGAAASYTDVGGTQVPATAVRTAPDSATGSKTFKYKVTALAADTYEESEASSEASCSGQTPTDTNPNVISWTVVSGAAQYNVYKEQNGVFGFIGVAEGTSFADNNIEPDNLSTPPQARQPFVGTGNYPAAVSYFQQRRCFANTDNAPEKIWMSRSGAFKNFSITAPLQEDDAVTFTLAGREVHEVRHLVEVDARFIVLTAGGEWEIQGDINGVVTPTEQNPRQLGANGAARVRPVVIGNTTLFVQARGGIVRDLRYEVSSDGTGGGYRGRDLSVFADHLFKGHTITDWDYQQIPESVVWAARDDGVLLGLTYMREHDVWGWHRHETDGAVENVVVVPEGGEDALYAVVRRTIGGTAYRYIERMASRQVTDITVDAFFVDSGLSYDGRNTTATTMTLSTGAGWTVQDVITVTASAGYFVAGDVGNDMVLRAGADEVRIRIDAYSSATVVTGTPSQDVPTSLRGVAVTDWGKAVDALSGLSHLEGKTVAILGDGVVEPQQAVSGGAITLTRPYEIIHVGLPYTADLETLDLEVVNRETLTDKKKRINRVTVYTQASRGFWAGPDADHLKEKPVEVGNYASPSAAEPAKSEVVLNSAWNDHGRVLIRQPDPMPLTVLAVVPSGFVED